MKSFTVNEKSDLKSFTDCTYPQGSFFYSALIKKGDIRVNGAKTRENCTVDRGDIVTYYTTPRQEAKPSHTVVFEDGDVYIADKFSGVNSEALFCEVSGVAPYPVHRLDRNTGGLIIIAKTQSVQQELVSAFKERLVEKIYLCVCKNSFKTNGEKLTAYLYKDGSGKVSIYDTPAEGREKIITEYEVQKSYGDTALVKVILHTGKTHQIRAHLAHIGCPVIGDTKYGDFALNKKYSAARQLLVAKSLTFDLPGELSRLNGRVFTSSLFPEIKK